MPTATVRNSKKECEPPVCCDNSVLKTGSWAGTKSTGLLPAIRTNIVGGVFYTQDAHLVPERFVLGLARHAEQNGAVIHTNTEVIGMKKSGRRITSVLTTRGDFTANEIVLAGGSWSPIIVA